MPYAPASCLTGLDQAGMTASAYQYYIWNFGQTAAQYEARVTAETTAGLAKIQSEVGVTASGPSTVFAAPFGAWGNGEDPVADLLLGQHLRCRLRSAHRQEQ